MSFRAHASRSRRTAYALRAAALVATLALTPAAQAQDGTWTGGGTDANWTTVDNWLGTTPPGTGGTVTFDANSASNLVTVNDFTGLSLNGIVVGAVPASNLVTIGGNSFTLGAGGIDLSAGGVASLVQGLTIALDANQKITLGASQTWKLFSQLTAGSLQPLAISSPIDGAVGADLTYGVTNISTSASSSGTIDLQVANTYAGNTTVGGPNTTYVLGSNSPFGAGTVTQSSFNTAPRYKTNGAVTISNAMKWVSGFKYTLDSAGSLTFEGAITFNGAAGNRTVDNLSTLPVTFNGPITLSATGETTSKIFLIQPASPGSVTVNGLIQDGDAVAGQMQKTGTGTAFINNTANTFAGLVDLRNGVLEIKSLANRFSPSSLGTGASVPDIRIGNTTIAATLRYTGTANVTTDRPISPFGSTGGATIENAGSGTMTFTADFLAGGNGNHTVTLSGTNTGANTISGKVIDPNGSTKVSLAKSGSGTWVLSGPNTYSGTTQVTNGILQVNGAHTPTLGAGNYTVAAGATLGGSGTIKPSAASSVTVATDGILSPGASIGTLTLDGALATGTVLTLASGATILDELNNSLASDKVSLINGAAGDIAFNSNTINFGDLSGGTLAAGAYTLFTADVAGAYSGLTTDGSGNITAGLSIGTGLSAYTFSLKQLRQVGNNIVLNIGLPGDFNGDGVVDAADYVVWRKNPAGYGGDPAGYNAWRSNFGRPPGSGSGLGGAAVPEPTAVVLAAIGLLVGSTLRFRQKRSGTI